MKIVLTDISDFYREGENRSSFVLHDLSVIQIPTSRIASCYGSFVIDDILLIKESENQLIITFRGGQQLTASIPKANVQAILI